MKFLNLKIYQTETVFLILKKYNLQFSISTINNVFYHHNKNYKLRNRIMDFVSYTTFVEENRCYY